MDCILDPEQQRRFTALIQQHRKAAGLHQWKVAQSIKLAGDLRSEISRFENGHPDVMARWLAEPYLPAVAAAYRFNTPEDLLDLVERARRGAAEVAADPWHAAFPGISRDQAEVERGYSFVKEPLLWSAKRGGPQDVVAELPADIERLTVVVDFRSGIGTVRRQLQAAWATTHPGAAPLELRLVDSSAMREPVAPAVYVEDWSLALLSRLVRRLFDADLMTRAQATRTERMLRQAPEYSVAGLPISLIIEAMAAEARADGPVGELHKRIVAAEWNRGIREPAGAGFTAADLGIYTSFWAEVALRCGSSDWSEIETRAAVTAADEALRQIGWHLPDATLLAQRAQEAAEVSSRQKRKEVLDEVALELLRPSPLRLVNLLVQMGLLQRHGERLRATNPAVATLAAAWGLAERPERLVEHPSVLCLPSAGRLFADIAVFGADPAKIHRAVHAAPAWADSDRDHLWIQFAASTTCPDGVVTSGLTEAWARVVYERSGPGRWFERIWANAPATRELDLALRTVSARFRAHLPVLGSCDDLVALVPEADRARIDGEALHPIVEEPRDPPRSVASVAQVAPWQCPALTFSELDLLESPSRARPGLGPLPDPREVAAAAAVRGFAPAQAWLAGEAPADSLFQRLPLSARLLCRSRGNAPEVLAHARDEVLWLLGHGGVDREALHRPITLTEEALPILHAALKLDEEPTTLWELAVAVLRRTGGLPPRSESFFRHDLPQILRAELADALDDVGELRSIEAQVDRQLRSERITTHAGRVSAFGEELSSRQSRFPPHGRDPVAHPLDQLARALASSDDAGHAAAVALFRRGEGAPLRRRAAGALAPVTERTRRAWLDAWRLADLWDAPLVRIMACLSPEDSALLVEACARDDWGSGSRDRAAKDLNDLKRLGIERADLTSAAEGYFRLRYCRAGSPFHVEIDQLALPLTDALAGFCDRMNDARPAELDLRRFYAERAGRALQVLVEAGDEATLRAWSESYRERLVSTGPAAEPALSPDDLGPTAIRIIDSDPREGLVQRVVNEALKRSARLRNLAWRHADEPVAAQEVLAFALDAGEPYPTWVITAVEREAARGRGWPHWRDLPSFRRQRLTWFRSRAPGEAASLVCLSFAEIAKDGPDAVVTDAANVVLDWLEATETPFLARRPLTFEGLGGQTEAGPAGEGAEVATIEPDRGPTWRELQHFLEAALRDPRCSRERVVAAVERLWDLLVAAPITHDASIIDGEPVHLQIHEGSREVLDDVARLLLLADAPGRIERLLREGVPPREGDTEESIEAAISAGFFPMLVGLPPGTRRPRTRSEVLQLRVLARFAPPNLDPRWMLRDNGLFEEWAWARLASRGDAEALDRMEARLRAIDLTDPRWIEAEPVLSVLIQHRRDVVVRWLLGEARRSPEHEEEARGVVVGWLHAWGERTSELATWARGGPMPAQ